VDLIPLQSKIHSKANFFPPNVSFVSWKSEFWRENFTLQKKVFPYLVCSFLLENNLNLKFGRFKIKRFFIKRFHTTTIQRKFLIENKFNYNYFFQTHHTIKISTVKIFK
jgi:hypothetical protein